MGYAPAVKRAAQEVGGHAGNLAPNGVLGSPRWMAGLMGRKGGRARTAAKAAAARANGQRGGRPRKAGER